MPVNKDGSTKEAGAKGGGSPDGAQRTPAGGVGGGVDRENERRRRAGSQK